MGQALPTQHLPTQQLIARRNKRTVVVALLLAASMVGMAYASVPLYDLFCRATGFGGTTQVATDTPQQMLAGHPVSVRFDANVNPALDWEFIAPRKAVDIVPGADVLVSYRATNLSNVPITGTATFNVTPQKAGSYFMKIDCFCFTEQLLAPGETVDMPVRFFIDPEIASDLNTKDIEEIVLSYTFFPLAGS